MSDGFSQPVSKFVSREEDGRMGGTGSHKGRERRLSATDRCHENNLQYATFFIEDHFLGIEVLKVQEVLTFQAMTRVPLAPQVIAGLINLRGQIVMAIDLRARLGFSPYSEGMTPMSVVVQTQDGAMSLLVDRIWDVIEVKPDLFEPPPEMLNERMREMTVGVYKLKDRLLIALDTETVTQVVG